MKLDQLLLLLFSRGSYTEYVNPYVHFMCRDCTNDNVFYYRRLKVTLVLDFSLS